MRSINYFRAMKNNHRPNGHYVMSLSYRNVGIIKIIVQAAQDMLEGGWKAFVQGKKMAAMLLNPTASRKCGGRRVAGLALACRLRWPSTTHRSPI